jgi:uncharacterized protein YciI
MFIILLKYIQPLTEIDKSVEAHRTYLDRYYASGHFICSGRQNPRVGGVILSNAESREEIESIINEDPFKQAGIAQYDILEFEPTKFAKGFETLIK